MLNPNVESGGGPFARGRAKPSAMGVWRTPKDEEYANPEGLVGRKVRVYFDGDCTFFEAQVHLYVAHVGWRYICSSSFFLRGRCKVIVSSNSSWLRLGDDGRSFWRPGRITSWILCGMGVVGLAVFFCYAYCLNASVPAEVTAAPAFSCDKGNALQGRV